MARISGFFCKSLQWSLTSFKNALLEPLDEILLAGPVLSLATPKPSQPHQKQLVRNPIQQALTYRKLLHSGKYKRKTELAAALKVTRVRLVQILNLIKKIAFGNNLMRFSQWYLLYTFLYHKKIASAITFRRFSSSAFSEELGRS